MLRINGLSKKKGFKDAKFLMRCGYLIHPYLLCIVCLFLSFHCSIENWTSLNYNVAVVVLWGRVWFSFPECKF